MSEKYKMSDPEGIYFVTATIVFWIDLFTRSSYKHIMVNAIKHCQKEKGLVVHAWCLMPSHLHLIISTNNFPLKDILRDLKKHTSKEIIKTIQEINESRKEWLLRAFINPYWRRFSCAKQCPAGLCPGKFVDSIIEYQVLV